MKVLLKVFAMVAEKSGIGKKGRTAFEQTCAIVQEGDGYPDCPVTVTHWDDKAKVLAPGNYTADLFFKPAPYGQMIPELSNFQQANAAGGAQRPAAARPAVAS